MVFEGGFDFLDNNVIFDPIDRTWIPGGFQPPVHSETASSTIFYLYVWRMTFLISENPGILSTPGWLYVYVYVYVYVQGVCVGVDMYINIYIDMYMYAYLSRGIKQMRYGFGKGFREVPGLVQNIDSASDNTKSALLATALRLSLAKFSRSLASKGPCVRALTVGVGV